MTAISVITNPDDLTLIIVAEFEASPDRVWQVWEDPRKLERWWGPPTYPATFSRHDFVVDGESRYHMTGPNGETPHGWWRIIAIDKPSRLDFVNGLAGDDGEPVPGVAPMPSFVKLDEVAVGTRMTAVTNFTSVEQMEMMLDMGMKDGMAQAIGQIDDVLSSMKV
jgi:uncharacterized protein YndB with AHSA1/START domain